MGSKITQYTSISTANPSETSLIDVSEFLPNSSYDTRKMSLGQLIDYVNPIPYPSMTFVLSNISGISLTLTMIKNTIGGSNPTVSVFVTQGGASIFTISHSSFTNVSSEYIISHSGTAKTNDSYACFYNTTNGQLTFRTFTGGVDSVNAMNQVVITYYKLN